MNDSLPTAWPSAPPPEEEHEYRVRRLFNGSGGPERGRVGTLDAMRRHWLIVLATVATLIVAGIGLGLVRKPVYTAEGRLSVQVAAPYPSAVASSISASSGLASIYSRAIDAPPVIIRVAKQTSLSPRQVMDRISATQVPDTGVVKVSATGPSERPTILLANRTTVQLQRYVSNNLSGSSPQSKVVFRKYKQAARRYQDRVEHLQELLGTSSSSNPSAALRQAQLEAEAAVVRRNGLARAYQTGQQLYSAPLEVIGRATSASSDRASRLQLFVLIGLVAGLAVGAVLATVQANSESRRRPA
jgi:uncharacterized protein involved in exopolysaccharide biosynthesis